jgi:hypothetical protein
MQKRRKSGKNVSTKNKVLIDLDDDTATLKRITRTPHTKTRRHATTPPKLINLHTDSNSEQTPEGRLA